MSGTASERYADDPGQGRPNGHAGNGHAVSDEDIRALLDKERASRRRVEQELQTERVTRNRAESQIHSQANLAFNAQEQAIQARLEAAEMEVKTLKKAAAEAMAEGNYAEVAEIQDRVVALRARQVQEQTHKAWLESERAKLQQQQVSQQTARQTDGIVDITQYNDKQRAWIKRNPSFLVDETIRAKTYEAHHAALERNIAVDSPDYYKLMDQFVRSAPDKTDTTDRTDRTSQTERDQDDDQGHELAPYSQTREPQRDQPLDMPVSRRQPEVSRRQQQEIRLTPDEREAADITLPDYPVEGYVDERTGKKVLSRYEAYVLKRNAMRQRGQG